MTVVGDVTVIPQSLSALYELLRGKLGPVIAPSGRS
jgi:hypothetical protein